MLNDVKCGVEISALIQRVEEAKAEFEENEDAYADHMEDEWKEPWRQERATERSVSEMFGSLTGDRRVADSNVIIVR
jgi:hypothetical protein